MGKDFVEEIGNLKMKVTVCFGTTRVIVPCPGEDMLVRDLIHMATTRYKKAVGKGQDSWVVVHKLKSQSDGGILDPDDKLVDVADDREQIMAIYEEDTDGMPSLQHNAGDGTSASSVGTNSPDIFQGNDHKFQPFARTDIEITGEELSSGPASGSPSGGSLSLQVRRGSEPALNRLSPVHLSPPDPSKRWSAAPVIDEDVDDSSHRNPHVSSLSVVESNSGYSQNGVRDVEGLTSRSSVTVGGNGQSLSVVSNNSVVSNTIEVHSQSNYNSNLVVKQQRVNSYSVNSNQIYGTTGSNANSDSSKYSLQHQQQLQQQQQQQKQLTNGHDYQNGDGVNGGDVVLPRSASAGSATLNRNVNGGSANVASNGVQLRLNPSKSNSHLTSQSSRFSRDSNRLSMQITNDGGARWADAADRALCLSLRKEPLGANASPETPTDSMPPPGAFSTPILYSSTSERDSFPVFHRESGGTLETTQEQGDDVEYFDDDETSHYNSGRNATVVYNSNGAGSEEHARKLHEEAVLLTFKYEEDNLGIHVAPEHLPNLRNQGLVVQSVAEGSRVARDGRLGTGDKIIEINGHSLIGVPFEQAKVMFKEGLDKPEIHLGVIKISDARNRRNFGAGVNANSENIQGGNDTDLTSVNVHNLVRKFSSTQNSNNGEEFHKNCEEEYKENMIQSHEQIVGDAKVATVSPTKKLPLQAVPLTRPASSTAVIASNTRKIGRKYEIDLQKGSQGLGFSVTTRDNPAGGNCPIYIKNILPTGAAIDDGRLRHGDRLLEVNGIEITGKSQSEAVSILRSVPQGGIVKLVVSRQERVDLSPKLPRQIPPEKIDEEIQPVPWSEREILGLDIPVLDTETAGLGISVKGKTQVAQKGNMLDMGIYIKSVIHGGAASRDGRLKSNDQLLSINGVSLLDRSNQDAMETLRRTMTQDGPKPKPGFITLTIARRVPSSSAPTTDISGCGSSASGDEMDSWGSKNVSISVDGNRSGEPDQHHSSTNENTMAHEQGNAVFLPAYNYNPAQNSQGQNQNSQQLHNRNEAPRTPQQNHEIYNQQYQNQHNARQNTSLSPAVPINSFPMDLPRNPVLERLTGKSMNPATRSESYYRATNETYNTTLIQSIVNGRNGREPHGHVRGQSITVQTIKGQMVLIEDDYAAPQKPPRRSRSSTPDDALNPPRKSEMTSPVTSPTGEPAVAFTDAAYASQTSLDDSGGFSRDAFGRQSMSEKRHATLDAKNTDTYQRNKKLREERDRQKQMHSQQEGMNDKRHAEALARERNLQDELARRGIKRPLSSSTEDNLMIHSSGHRSPTQQMQGNYGATRYSSGGGGFGGVDSGAKFYGQQRVGSTPEMTASESAGVMSLSHSPSCQLATEGRHIKARKGFGDQLIELFHQWGHRNQTRGEGGLQRVNSADSLVDVVKQQQQPQHEQRHKSPKGRKSREKENEVEFKIPKKDIGPSLGMKKSSSLESLQTMVQEITSQEDVKSGIGPVRAGPGTVRVVRGRGCNESFRQAVDRSYEAPLGELGNQMETLAEEETESCISGATYGQTQRLPYSEPSESEMDGIYGKTKGAKKKQSILRGLGSMFRFGRHRKSGSGGLSAAGIRKQQAEIERQEREEMEEAEKEKARQAAQTENFRIQEQYRRLLEKQKADAQHGGGNSNYGITVSISSTNRGNDNGNYGHSQNYGQVPNLRPNHQFRKSMENQSIRERERERERDRRDQQEMRDVNGNHFQQQPAHLRSASYDVYNEMTRPGSRVGFADPKKYTHYINYEEIQHHLNDDKTNGNLSEEQLRQMRQTVVEQRKKAILESRRHQQHYHSQRRENPKQRQDRPVSNFYEYESVQAAMHSQHGSPNKSSHSHNHQSPPHQMQGQGRPMNQPEGHQQHQHQQQQQHMQQQPIYGTSTYGHTGMNNNGITLPSPSTMMPVVHQRSASQFQAQTMPNHSRQQLYVTGPIHPSGNSGTLQPQSSQNKFSPQQPNSLPRRSQKEVIIQAQQHQQSVNPTNHRHPQQQQMFQSQQVPGRYIVSSNQPSSIPSQNYRSLNPPSSSAQRHQPSATHMHSHPNGIGQRNHPNMSLGSKV